MRDCLDRPAVLVGWDGETDLHQAATICPPLLELLAQQGKDAPAHHRHDELRALLGELAGTAAGWHARLLTPSTGRWYPRLPGYPHGQAPGSGLVPHDGPEQAGVPRVGARGRPRGMAQVVQVRSRSAGTAIRAWGMLFPVLTHDGDHNAFVSKLLTSTVIRPRAESELGCPKVHPVAERPERRPSCLAAPESTSCRWCAYAALRDQGARR